jgi:DNA-binding IclR family transcriptional regulator
VLASFSEARPEVRVGELASELGLHKSTVSRLLGTLEARGLVRRLGDAFVPGPELVRLGSLATRGFDLVGLVREPLTALAEETGETVNLAVRHGDQALNVHQVESSHLVGVRDWTGRALPLHCTANGKVLLAFGDGPIPRSLPRMTAWTLDRNELEENLDLIRERGYAIAVEELELGLHAVAAPLLDGQDRCVSAVSVSGPSYRLSEKTLGAVGELCAARAREASALLGRRRAA